MVQQTQKRQRSTMTNRLLFTAVGTLIMCALLLGFTSWGPATIPIYVGTPVLLFALTYLPVRLRQSR